MGVYLANRIYTGNLEYSYVISKRPDLKVDIDTELIRLGGADLITS